jgi:hypothetical protein
MEFYLNQKSLPMIRKCASCKFYIKDYQACSLMSVTNAYDYTKKIYMNTGDNLFCESHEFKNEETLEKEAIVVEFDSVLEAMESINRSKEVKSIKGGNRWDIEDEDETNYNRQ